MQPTFALVSDFAPGNRVELCPSTDTWARGDRFGTVRRIGRKWLHVEMDRSGRTLRVHPVAIGRKV